MSAQALRILTEFSHHPVNLILHGLRVVNQRASGGRQGYTPPSTFKQCNAQPVFHPLDPGACGGQRQSGPFRANRDAAALGDKQEKPQIHQIEAHSTSTTPLPSSLTKAGNGTSIL